MRFKYDYQHMSNHLDIKCKICFTKFVKYFYKNGEQHGKSHS